MLRAVAVSLGLALGVAIWASMQEAEAETEMSSAGAVIAFDELGGPIHVREGGLHTDDIKRWAPGYLWRIEYWEDVGAFFVCTEEPDGWRGYRQVGVSADSIWVEGGDSDLEVVCRVEWGQGLRVGGVPPTTGVVRIDSLNDGRGEWQQS